MTEASDASKLPLPFATALIGLILGFLYSSKFSPTTGTFVGFLFGVGILLYKHHASSRDESPPPTSVSFPCPNCGTGLQVETGEKFTVLVNPEFGHTRPITPNCSPE